MWLWLAGCGYISESDHAMNTRLPVVSVTEITGETVGVCGSTGMVIRATGHPQLEGRQLLLTVEVADELTLPAIDPAVQNNGVIEWRLGDVEEFPASGELVFDMQIETFGLTLRQTRTLDVGGYPQAYADGDGDGFGDGPALQACAPVGSVDVDGDCNDLLGSVYPGAPELCDGLDNDCDDAFDEGDSLGAGEGIDVFVDDDGDGFGAGDTVRQCPATPGFSVVDGDCDDGDPTRNPEATEQCDALDWDCSGDPRDVTTDVPGALELYDDADGDGFGADTHPVYACDAVSGLVENDDDCDDSNGQTYMGAPERCDGLDNDCSGLADDDDTLTAGFYVGEDRFDTLQDAIDAQPVGVLDLSTVVCGDVDFSRPVAPDWTSISLGVGDRVSLAGPGGNLRGRLEVTGAGTFELHDTTWAATGTANGAALRIEGTTGRISEVEFVGPAVSPPARGGCLSIDSADVEIEGGRFDSCRSLNGGGAVEVMGSDPVRFTDVNLINNNTAGSGGALIASDDAVIAISGDFWTANRAAVDGGAVWMQQGELTVSGVTFANNVAEVGGGAIGLTPGASATVSSSFFESNRAEHEAPGSGGGAIWSRSGALSVESTNFTANFATFDGGAVFIGDGGEMTATGSTAFIDNTASAGTGGAIRAVEGSTVGLLGSALADNRAFIGGAIHTEGMLDLSSATLSRNQATLGGNASRGGAVLVGPGGPSTVHVDGAEFVANSTSGRGGAVQVESEGLHVNLVTGRHAVFRENDAADGAAFFVERSADDVEAVAAVSLEVATFADNGGEDIVGGARGCVFVTDASVSDSSPAPPFWALWNAADALESSTPLTDFACDATCTRTTTSPSCLGDL